ncbi:cell envelope integrity protein TolA [Thiomicrorhabdus sp. zzn3]|uniref:cell envelope integrity protein TolA n=1 Tax=Thiomicrorhabdus sp. zzn3 TaxID=3039775 RepID=UPI002436C12D|nr:cell envelope integrity protein TolA [Thiomicrorhabdus sp. zzn3]MDG6778203.1 cell envelope integrity protein TolA [Thiomicrorhabdus sp. zzn3]
MIQFIVRHPFSVLLAVLIHIAVAIGVVVQWQSTPHVMTISSAQPSEETTQAVKTMETMKTFAVDSKAVEEQIARIKAEEAAKKAEQQRLKQQADKERARLAEIKKQKQLEEQKAQEAKRLAEQQKRQAEAEKRKAAEAKRLAEIERQKVAAAKKRAEAEKAKAEKARQQALLAEKKQQQAKEQIAKAEAQRKLEEEKKKALEAEIATKAAEKQKLQEATLQAMLAKEQAEAKARLEQQLAQEEAMRREQQKRQQLMSLKETYISSISAKVKDNWRTPARISEQAQCELDITQTPGGRVTSVKVVNCNQFANEQFKEAAEKAVYRSEPLPEPPVPELFERNIRFVFKP